MVSPEDLKILLYIVNPLNKRNLFYCSGQISVSKWTQSCLGEYLFCVLSVSVNLMSNDTCSIW